MNKTKKITCTALLCALAYAAVIIGKAIPISLISFLKYDPKDIIIVIGGFLYGPMTAFLISAVVSLAEMLTISETGLIGFVMNVISSCAFACVASAVYGRNRRLPSAIAGLALGTAASAATMLVWNYALTPLYMEIPRGDVVKMLLPVFLPFNLIKCTINSSLAVMLYKPFVKILRKTGMAEMRPSGDGGKPKLALYGAAVFTLLMCAAAIAILRY